MDYEDEYPLHAAINQVAEKRRQWLKDKGVDVDSWIVEGELKDLVKHLKSNEISDISETELAAKWQDLDKEAADEMEAVLTKTSTSVDVPNDIGTTALRVAVDKGNAAAVAVLLEHGANMEAAEESILHVAVKNGNLVMVTVLLDKGADLTAREEYGSTTLHIAARSGDVAMVELLLKRGADLKATEEDGSTVLHAAVGSGNWNMVSVLLENGADVAAAQEDGRTPLHVAACYRSTEIVKLLLKKGASATAVDKLDRNALHFAACYSNTKMVKLLLKRGVKIDAVDKIGNNPLSHMIVAQHHKLDDEGVAVAQMLCLQGSEPKVQGASELEKHQLGLQAIAQYWHRCYQEGKPLVNVAPEIIAGGPAAVEIYVDDLEKTTDDERIKRCKVCIVGPSTWGKTSLVKSIAEKAPSVMDADDRTIGIDLYSFSFSGAVNAVTGKAERHDVTFWDFAGQDIYQVAHAVFFSTRTLYLLCIDLQVYSAKITELKRLVDAKKRIPQQRHHEMQRFFEENVLHWLRAVLQRKRDAQFKLIGTKKDLVLDASALNSVWIDLNNRLTAFLGDANRQVELSDSVRDHLADEINRPLVATSVSDQESLQDVRKAIEAAILASPNLSIDMPKTHYEVLECVVKLRRSAQRQATREGHLERAVLPLTDIIDTIMHEVSDLPSSKCREILRTLHRLGDILWYEDGAKELQQLVVTDPTVLLDLIREVINHEYEDRPGALYDALRLDGTVMHSLLMGCSTWKALEASMVPTFKKLLLDFFLAYPASPDENFDLIVPSYWKLKEASRALANSFSRQPSVLDRNYVVGASIAKWKYSLPVAVSEAIFINFVVRSYRPEAAIEITGNCFNCFVRGEFGVAIYLRAHPAKLIDDITIEVAAATPEIAWAEMRYYVIAMEQVLLQYPGLAASKVGDVQRYDGDVMRFIVDTKEECHSVNYLIGEVQQTEEQLRGSKPWFPPQFRWFIERAWENPGMLDQLQVSRELTILQKFMHNGDKRKFPAVWTLSYPENSSTIELRMHSDLSGMCFHRPLEISRPNGFADFVAENSDFIRVGISVLSIATALIPIAVASSAVELALSASSGLVDRAATVKSVLDKAHLSAGTTAEAQRGFLQKLLTLHDETFDISAVGDVANLCCAATEDGSYVWVHPSEMEKLKGHLTPRASISLCVSDIQSSSKSGRMVSRKKVYCAWEIVHSSRPDAIKYGETERAVIPDGVDPVWTSSAVELENVTTVEMLRECTLKVSVKQARHLSACFRKNKVIGQGQVRLEQYFQIENCSVEISIPLNGVVSPAPTLICQITVEGLPEFQPIV